MLFTGFVCGNYKVNFKKLTFCNHLTFYQNENIYFQRRWLVVSNPGLCGLISKWLGTDAWIRDIDLLMGLRDHAADAELQQEWQMVNISCDLCIM